MGILRTLASAAIAGNIATAASAQDTANYQDVNRSDAMRVAISLQSDCQGDLSDQTTAFTCFRNSAWEMYDFAVTTQQKFRNSGLPAGMVFPASHVIEYGCLKPTRELSTTQIEFAGIADIRDRIVNVMEGCDEALRAAETMSQRTIGDFSILFNYGTMNALSSHAEWLGGIRPELLDAAQGPDVN